MKKQHVLEIMALKKDLKDCNFECNFEKNQNFIISGV